MKSKIAYVCFFIASFFYSTQVSAQTDTITGMQISYAGPDSFECIIFNTTHQPNSYIQIELYSSVVGGTIYRDSLFAGGFAGNNATKFSKGQLPLGSGYMLFAWFHGNTYHPYVYYNSAPTGIELIGLTQKLSGTKCHIIELSGKTIAVDVSEEDVAKVLGHYQTGIYIIQFLDGDRVVDLKKIIK